MGFRQQAPVSINWQLTVKSNAPVRNEITTFPFGAKPHVLKLAYHHVGKAIVNFGDVNVGMTNPSHFKGEWGSLSQT